MPWNGAAAFSLPCRSEIRLGTGTSSCQRTLRNCCSIDSIGASSIRWLEASESAIVWGSSADRAAAAWCCVCEPIMSLLFLLEYFSARVETVLNFNWYVNRVSVGFYQTKTPIYPIKICSFDSRWLWFIFQHYRGRYHCGWLSFCVCVISLDAGFLTLHTENMYLKYILSEVFWYQISLISILDDAKVLLSYRSENVVSGQPHCIFLITVCI